jgi:hypothetical protein
MKFINGWKYVKKDSNRFHFVLRISVLTVYEVFVDFSDKKWKIMVCNIGLQN